MGKNCKVSRNVKSLAVVKSRPVRPKRNAYLNAKAIMHMQATEQPIQKNTGSFPKKVQSSSKPSEELNAESSKRKTSVSLKEQKQGKTAAKLSSKARSKKEKKLPASKQPKFVPRGKRIASLNAQAMMAIAAEMEKPRRLSIGEVSPTKRKSLDSVGANTSMSSDKSISCVDDNLVDTVDLTIVKTEKCDPEVNKGVLKTDKSKASQVLDTKLTQKTAVVDSSTTFMGAPNIKKLKLSEAKSNAKKQSGAIGTKPKQQTAKFNAKVGKNSKNSSKKLQTLKIRILKTPIKAKINDDASTKSEQKHRVENRSSNESAQVNSNNTIDASFVRPFLGYYGYYSGYSYPVVMPYPYFPYICNQPEDVMMPVSFSAAEVVQNSTHYSLHRDRHSRHRTAPRNVLSSLSKFPTLLPRPTGAVDQTSPTKSGIDSAMKRASTRPDFIHSSPLGPPPPLVPIHVEQGMSPLVFQLPPSHAFPASPSASHVPYYTRLDNRHLISPVDNDERTTCHISHDVPSPYAAVGPDVYRSLQAASRSPWPLSSLHTGNKSHQSSFQAGVVSPSSVGRQSMNNGQPTSTSGSPSKRKKECTHSSQSSDKCVGTHSQQHGYTHSGRQTAASTHHGAGHSFPSSEDTGKATSYTAVAFGSGSGKIDSAAENKTMPTAAGENAAAESSTDNTSVTLTCDTTTKAEAATSQLSSPNKTWMRPKRASKETAVIRMSVSPVHETSKAASAPKIKKRQNDDANLAVMNTSSTAGSGGFTTKYSSSPADAGEERMKRPLKRKSEDVPVTCRWHWKGAPTVRPVPAGQAETVAEMRTCYQAIEHDNGDVISVRDCVLIKSGPRKTDPPFVARIAAFWSKIDESENEVMMMTVLWYYRIEHTDVPPPLNLIDCELFASKHRDDVAVTCIEDICHVLTLNEYCRYVARQKRLAMGIPRRTIVPEGEGQPSARPRLPAINVSADSVFLCRRVYDIKLKRILRNPCIGSSA